MNWKSDMHSSPGLIAFSPKTQFENIGDALINRELLSLATRYGEVLIDISRCPPSFARTICDVKPAHGLQVTDGFLSLARKLLFQRLRGRRVYYLLSPGGYFGGKGLTGSATMVLASSTLCFFKLLGVSIVHIGVSYERLTSAYSHLLKWRSKLLYAHVVRDKSSQSYAIERGIRITGIMPDLALNAGQKVSTENPVGIGLTFRVDQCDGQAGAVKLFVETLDRKIAPNLPFHFISQVRRDHDFARELASYMSQKSGRTFYVKCVDDSIESAISAYAECKIVISNRLHSLLIGLLAGAGSVPAVIGDKNAKVRNYFEQHSIPATDLLVPDSTFMTEFPELYRRGGYSMDLSGQKEELARMVGSIFSWD